MHKISQVLVENNEEKKAIIKARISMRNLEKQKQQINKNKFEKWKEKPVEMLEN